MFNFVLMLKKSNIKCIKANEYYFLIHYFVIKINKYSMINKEKHTFPKNIVEIKCKTRCKQLSLTSIK